MSNDKTNERPCNDVANENVTRKFRVIDKKDILDIEKYNILPIGTDEVFVKINGSNTHYIEKLVEQNKIDIEALKEKHRLDMEIKEKDYQHQIELINLQHQNELKKDEEKPDALEGLILAVTEWVNTVATQEIDLDMVTKLAEIVPMMKDMGSAEVAKAIIDNKDNVVSMVK